MIKLVLGCLVVTACAFGQAMQESVRSDSGTLVALERMWNQAQVSRDASAMANMIGDKFVNTEFDGEVSDRQKFLTDFADPKFKPVLMNIEDVKVEMYPSTAVVTGSYHTRGTYAGKPYEHFGRFTDTWVYQNKKWQCVASHSSLLKK